MNNFYVYILKCSDGSYYTGHTSDLDRRISEHQQGTIDGYTLLRRPVELVFHEVFETKNAAFEMERKIKGWTRRKKEALITGDWLEISRLAKGKKR